MIIRKATTEDIPAIVQLLKASLGDVSSTKSIEYWNWKHVNNPFGPSLVLVVEEAAKLIGVRAFMRWDWREGPITYRALRAVDTATHPDYQGKGIFKKLTLQLVEQAKEEGYDFIFNTPNLQSKPGYLKMAWEEWGRMPLWLQFVPSFKKWDEDEWNEVEQLLKHYPMQELNLSTTFKKGIHSSVTTDYLIWRYRNCPVKKYGIQVVTYKGKEVVLFFSCKRKDKFTELRICDWFFKGATDLSFLLSAGAAIARKLGCRLVTYSGLQSFPLHQRLLAGLLPVQRWSVLITIRMLSDNSIPVYLKTPGVWQPETGAMELF